MKYKKKLQKALKEAGLSEALAEFITIESEDQIEAVVEQLTQKEESDELDFKKVLASKDFSEFVTENGIDEILKTSKTLKSEYDRKVSTGIKTFKKKFLKDEIDVDEDDDEDVDEGKKGGKNDGDMPKWAKKLMEKVDGLEKGSETKSKKEQAKALFSKSETLQNLPEKLQGKWLDRINLDSETSFEDQIKGLEEEVTELGIAKGSTENPGLPTGGKPSKDKASAEVLKVVDSMI